MKFNKSGFTLIELMTVVVILGMLMTVFQTKIVKSMDANTILRGADMVYTCMKLSKHLSVLENRSYAFTAYNSPTTPDNASWEYSKIEVYKGIEPFYYADFSSSANYTITSFSFQLTKNATLDCTKGDADISVEGSGTQSDPWSTTFKYYGPVSNNMRYHVCTHSRRMDGVSAVAGNENLFMTAEVAGGNFSGAPLLNSKGHF